MGLQNGPIMSAVPAHHVTKPSRPTSAMSSTSSRDLQTSVALEDDVKSLTLKGDFLNGGRESGEENNGEEGEGRVSKNNGDDDEVDNEQDQEYEINVYDDLVASSDEDDPDKTDTSRLSTALKGWMPHYIITPLPRQGHTMRLPVFSARLGKESDMKRADSAESIVTQLSLFSCSSHGSRIARERKRRRLRRRKTASADHQRQKPASAGTGSKWVQLAKRRKGELDRFMMAQSHALAQGFNLTDESEAFELFEPDERKALFRCGRMDKLAFAANLKKSDSMTNLKEHVLPRRPRPRVHSAGAKTFWGKPIDFHELRRQYMNQRLAALTSLSAHHSHHGRRSSGRRSLRRSGSRHSLTSVGSGDVFFATPPLSARREGSDYGGEGGKEKAVSVWKADDKILAIDLKKELTSKVKQRIGLTTFALERLTGLGDDNEHRPYTCHLPEFPRYIEDDFAVQPKIPQKIRISPQLSDVIKSDIRVRMGRPRYHAIREHDLELWNRGQTLGRAHRNLKVFNWLHSLREDQFDAAVVWQDIKDVPPDPNDVTFGEMVLIRAVDEPDVRPLYQQKKAKSFML